MEESEDTKSCFEIIWPLKVKQKQNDSCRPMFLPKNEKNKFNFYYETSGWLVFVRFLKEIEDTKKTFRNYLTYRKGKKCAYFIMLQIKALIKKMSLIPYLKILFTLKRMLTSQSEFKKNIFWLYNIENFIWFYAEVMYKSFSLKKESFSDLLLKYRLFFLRSIVYMNCFVMS